MEEQNGKCEIYFEMSIITLPNEQVRIVGDIPSIGGWSPSQGLPLSLSLSPDSTHKWKNTHPLLLHTGEQIEFKLVVMQDQNIIRWEQLPQNSNRKYKAKYPSILLKGAIDSVEGTVKVLNQKHNQPQPQNTIVTHGSLNSEDLKLIQKHKITNIDPFQFADHSDTDESLSEIQSSFDKRKYNHSNFQNCDHLQTLKELSSSEEDIPNITLAKIYKKQKQRIQKEYKARVSQNEQKTNDTVGLEQTGQRKSEALKEDERVIIISIYLPFILDLDSNQQIVIKQNHKDLVYFSRSIQTYGHQNIYFIGGCLQSASFPCDYLNDPIIQSEIRKRLWAFNCLPLFFPNHQLDILFNTGGFKVKFIQSDHIQDMKGAFTKQSQDLRAIETNFGKDVLNVFENIKNLTNLKDRKVYVLVNDQQLALLSTLLKQHQLRSEDNQDMFFHQIGQFRMGMHMNMAFPATERLKLKPDSKMIIKAILLYDIIIFDDFQHSRPFFSCLQKYFGVKYFSKQGILTIPFDNREVIVLILGQHINTQQVLLKATQSLPPLQHTHYKHFILSIDSQSELTEFTMKFNLLLKYFQEKTHHNILNHIKMLQVIKRKGNKDEEQLFITGLEREAQRVNEQLKSPLIELVFVEEGNQEQLFTYMKQATIFLKTCLNSICSPQSLEYMLVNQQGLSLMSDYIVFNKNLKSLFTFNPMSYSKFKTKLSQVLNVTNSERILLKKQDLLFLEQNDIYKSWLVKIVSHMSRVSVDPDKQAIGQQEDFHFQIKLIRKGLLCLGGIQGDHGMKTAWQNSKSRLIIMDTEEVVFPLEKHLKKLEITQLINGDSHLGTLATTLQSLGQHSEVYFMSSNTQAFNDRLHLNNVTMCAEHGAFYKQKCQNDWTSIETVNDSRWKQVVNKIFKFYTLRTDGSWIENRETSLLWRYSSCQEELGQEQGKELYRHLQSVLEHVQDIEIVENRLSIEVRRRVVDRGLLVQLMIQQARTQARLDKVDFVLIVSSKANQYEYFNSLPSLPVRHLYSAVLGLNDTLAKYYIPNRQVLLDLLKSLPIP